MCTLTQLHNKMRDDLTEKVNKANGRKRLADEAGCDLALITGILDFNQFPTIRAYEHWFGSLGIDAEDVDIPVDLTIKVATQDPVEPAEPPLPFIIECEAFDQYKAMVRDTGYEIRIVHK